MRLSTFSPSIRRATIAIAIALWVASTPARADGPLDFIPAKTDVIVMVDVAEILKSDASTKTTEQFPDIKAKLDESFGPKTKLTARDIEKVFIAGSIANKEFVMAVRTARKVKMSEVLTGEFAEAEQVGDFKMYVRENVGEAMTLIGDGQVILVGTTAALRQSLATPGENELPAELLAVLETLDRDGFHAACAVKLDQIYNEVVAVLPPPFTSELLKMFKVATVSATCAENVSIKY